MTLDARKTGGLALSYQEVLTAAARLRSKRQDPRDVAIFRQHCRDALLAGADDARHAGYRFEDVRSASYAVAAYLDESVMHAADVRFAAWLQNPLELELFHTRDAEEVFYSHLRDALARSDAGAADVVEVYAICLLLGFMGMYGPATAERKLLIQRCGEALRRARGPLADLSPAWRIPAPWKKPSARQASQRSAAPECAPIDDLVRQAEVRLSLNGCPAGLRESPAVLVLGEPGSVKTSSLLHCGVERHELAGEVYRDGNVAPTPLANFWFARPAVLVEAGGALLPDRARWLRLLEHLRPVDSSPRYALVCLDAERLARPNAAEVASRAAAYLGEHLKEYAHAAGRRIPVYVLFTRMDRITGFAEFVRKMTHEEAARAVGATLPEVDVAGDTSAALATRLKSSWDGIYHSLAGARTELLGRESDWARAGLLYEFPREFHKMKGAAVRFLSELCPAGLPGGPFLRGFYCSGARPIVIEENAPPPPAAAATISTPLATGMFGGAAAPQASAPSAPPPAASRRKIPQWLFLPHLFHDVLLRDIPES